MMQAKDTYDNILACSPFKSKVLLRCLHDVTWRVLLSPAFSPSRSKNVASRLSGTMGSYDDAVTRFRRKQIALLASVRIRVVYLIKIGKIRVHVVKGLGHRRAL